MLALQMRAVVFPTYPPSYAYPMHKPAEKKPLDLLHLVDEPFRINPHHYMAITTIILERFTYPYTHTDFFQTLRNVPNLVVLQAEPAPGVFPELDLLDAAYSPSLAPPRIPTRRGHRRISFEKLRNVLLVGKPSFCAAFVNECEILHSCALELQCKGCVVGPRPDPIDDILSLFQARLHATLATGDDFDDNFDDVMGTEQKLEIDATEISITDDTRHAPVQCNTLTKLLVQNTQGIDHRSFLPRILPVFGAESKPCVITLQGEDVTLERLPMRELLDWLGGFDPCLLEVKFVGNQAFRVFAPLFKAPYRSRAQLLMPTRHPREAICQQLIELHFERAAFGAGTANQEALLRLLDSRKRMGAQIERLLFDECTDVDKDDFPSELEILIDGDADEGDDHEEEEEDDDMDYEDDESDGNESDTTVTNSQEVGESEDDSMDWEVN